MNSKAIGVFDSGVGGLTAVRQLQALLPHERIVYFGDTGRVPYGTRSRETIIQYAQQDIRFLHSKQVKFLLAACGTISSILPADYTGALPIPYIGVVEAATAAALAASKTGRIGVIATPATIRSGSYEAQIHALEPDSQVFATSCPMFVPLVENGYVGPDNPITTAIAHEYLDPLCAHDVDVLILGCTHYPLIAPILQKIMGPGVTLIDSGQQAALVVRQQLANQGLLAPVQQLGSTEYYVSDVPQGFEAALRLFIGSDGAGPVVQVPIDNY